METEELPEPAWAQTRMGYTDKQALQSAIQAMHNGLLQELRMLVVEQRRTNQLLEWLGTTMTKPDA